MTVNNYDPSTALSAYYPTRDERRPARLWAREKFLHDMADAGMIEFFEGPGTNPTALSGYSLTKLWLRVSSGVTASPGEVRAYDGAGDPSDIANWPVLTRGAFLDFLGVRPDLGRFETNADVLASVIASSVGGITTLGGASVGDGQWAFYKRALSEPSHAGKVASADGAWWEDAGFSDITIKIPTDFATLQAAIDATHNMSMRSGNRIILLIESGHEVTAGISVANGDYGRYIVKSEDETVAIASSFSGRFISAQNAIAPTLDCYVDGDGRLDRIYSLIGSIGAVTPGNGGEGCTGRPLYGNSSFIQAGQTVWKNSGDSIYASAGSGFQMGGCEISGFTVTANGTLVASRGSAIEAQGMSMSDCARGIECKRASSGVNAHEATFDNIGGFIARASRGATVSLEECTATNIVNSALEAFGGTITAAEGASFTAKAGNSTRGCIANGGGRIDLHASTVTGFGTTNLEARAGKIDATSATITDAGQNNLLAWHGGKISAEDATITGAGTDDARVLNGGEITMDGATTTNSSATGTPNIADTNVSANVGFNTPTAAGVIYAGTASSLASGTYSATITAVENVSASTANTCQYIRYGSIVTVSGKVSITPAAASETATRFRISLPIATDFVSDRECAGTIAGAGNRPTQAGVVRADGANDEAEAYFAANTTSATDMCFQFTYRVQ